jgi:hypothetical protein
LKVLVSVSLLVFAISLVILYQIGLPHYGFEKAYRLMPALLLMMAITPIALLKTRWVDAKNKQTVGYACCLALVMPLCLWQIGNILVMQIASVGGCFDG